jgi:hypothetical protein
MRVRFFLLTVVAPTALSVPTTASARLRFAIAYSLRV